MWISLAWAAAFAASPAPLADVGEQLAGLYVVEVQSHPEFERVAVELADGRTLQLEVNAVTSGAAACQHHGLSLFPRWELLDEEVDLEDQPAVVEALCDRLASRGESLALRSPRGGSEETTEKAENSWTLPSTETPPPAGWLDGVLLALLGTLALAIVWTLRQRPPSRRELTELGLLTAGAALLRWALSPRTVYWGPFFGYGRLTEAWGIDGGHPLYGDGFATLVGPLSRWLSFSPDALFGLHGLMATLAPALLWVLTRLMLGAGPLPLLAGLSLALLPTHLRLSTSEAMHIDVLTLELLAVVAAVAATRVSGGVLAAVWALVAALATGFVAHLRPEAILFGIVPASWLLAHGSTRRLPAIAIAAAVVVPIVGIRALDVLALGTSGAVQLNKLTQADFWVQVAVPQVGPAGSWNATNTFLQLRLTPMVLPVLALASLWTRRRWMLAWLGLWAVAVGLVVLPKSWPLVDAMRLQLPLQAPLLLAAALGAEVLLERRPLPGWVLPAAVVGLSLPLIPTVTTRWAVHEEFSWLREALPELPKGATIVYDDASQHHEGFGRWSQAQSPQTTWVGIDSYLAGAPVSEPLLLYRGVSCLLGPAPRREPPPSNCSRLTPRCTITPTVTTDVGTNTDVDVMLTGEVTIGFHTLRCGAKDP